MRIRTFLTVASVVLATSGIAAAQTANKGLPTPQKGSAPMGDPQSGSGTSTSGGRDANGNQGRDAMPESNINVKPLDQQGRKENGAPK